MKGGLSLEGVKRLVVVAMATYHRRLRNWVRRYWTVTHIIYILGWYVQGLQKRYIHSEMGYERNARNEVTTAAAAIFSVQIMHLRGKIEK